MSGSTVTVPSKKGTSTLVRPRFAPGMLLQHEDLDQLSTYTRELSRLLFRSFFGCGVVCGLVVKTDPKCGEDTIVVGAGLGLDCAGDPIYVPKDVRVVLDENCEPNPNDVLWVVLCATTKCCAPRAPMCPSDDDDDETASCTRERDGFEIRVVAERPKCACSCVHDEENADDDDNYGTNADDAAVRGTEDSECWCVNPNDPCYIDHYLGVCGCGCADCARGACCDCIILAQLTKNEDGENVTWTVDHSVRRFIRPVLIRDPQVEIERKKKEEDSKAVAVAKSSAAAPAVAPASSKTKSKSSTTPTR